ncbi:MAG TPA: PSD1 and planctomycete cytochrome C domain-containing protein [Gemmataceae bacterium]|nr:PSD1 and planctomycete cytochrome C domain-containing protein [Gemmataceae bacterium]
MRRLCCSLVMIWMSVSVGRADPPDAAGRAFFEQKIRPLLVKHCYECHSTAAKKHKGGLALDSRDSLRKGGDSGPVIVPGDPNRSLLIQAVHHDGLEMPPKKRGKLSEREIAALERWVRMGAPDPRTETTAAAADSSWVEALAQRRHWWSLQPVGNPAVPGVRNRDWCLNALDRFLLARLEEHGLQPAADAERRTLIRRLSLVLTGLVPAPAEVEAFVRDDSPNAYRKLVDRLLASPHFGEQWAQHWLDVVRFSETHGKGENYEVPYAWRYRDYLVRAFNDDVPYDRLIREHIAGDLLPPRWNRRERLNESLIGTFFWRPGEVDHEDCIGFLDSGFDRADNQIDTLGKAFLATTVACARCHDHKIDAVSTRDYHKFLGIIRGSRQVMHTIDAAEVNAASMQRLRDLKTDFRRELGKLWLAEAASLSRYLLAAQAKRAKQADADRLAAGLNAHRLERWIAALKGEPTPSEAEMVKLLKRFSLTATTVRMARTAEEDPLAPWRAIAGAAEFPSKWQEQAAQLERAAQERAEFNQRQFLVYADFTDGKDCGWRRDGHALRDGPRHAGDFALHSQGETLVQAILPGGWFTHSLSSKLNGALQSPVLASRSRRYMSLLVCGKHGSTARLVCNNCQLAYVNARYLDCDEPHWATITIPKNPADMRVYAELMTVFDNPKFPDPSAGIAGDNSANVELPWEQAIRSRERSYFGVSRVVMHDEPEVPKPELRHLLPLFQGNKPARLADWATRYGEVAKAAVQAWADDHASEDDVRWLDYLVRHELLSNRVDISPRLRSLADAYRAVETKLARPRVIPGMADWGAGFDQPLFLRGDCTHPGEAVPRGYLEALSSANDSFHTRGSGRLELADRIACADNPLTARVMINRIWHHLFGTGIVATVDDFGHYGEQPSPADVRLLDHLATRFVQEGWSIKRLIRTVVLSHSFRTENRPSPAARQLDPRNRWLQHYPARAMQAEMVRDAMLSVSGRLDRSLGGPSIEPFREKPNPRARLFSGPLDGEGRRSLYLKRTLMAADRFLEVFNATGGKVTLGRRDVTNVPSQALMLMNGSLARQQAAVWASRLTLNHDRSIADRLDGMFRSALGRPPDTEERQRFETAIRQWAGDLSSSDDVLKNEAVWTIAAHAFFNLQEFVFIP